MIELVDIVVLVDIVGLADKIEKIGMVGMMIDKMVLMVGERILDMEMLVLLLDTCEDELTLLDIYD